MTHAGERPRREFEVDQRAWAAIDAWRDSGDLGLCYMVPLEDGDPVRDDREDRRSTLEPGQLLRDLEAAALDTLWSAGVPLTETERRLVDPDNHLWLAQNTGPVWAEGGGASDATGVLFRCLSASRPHIGVSPAGHLRDESTDWLRGLLAPEGASS